jgi:hypothetical protein
MTNHEKLMNLSAVQGLLNGILARYPVVPAEIQETLSGLFLTMSTLLPGNSLHSRGAYALCAGCGRYSMDARTCHPTSSGPPSCDCGRSDKWTKDFPPPGKKSSWSFGHKARRAAP